MPEAICDTSPLQYLHQLGLLDLLPALYGRLLVPRAVATELAVGRAAGVNVPDPEQLAWIDVRDVEPSALANEPALGAGEREVLALGAQVPDALLIMDDALARQFARRSGLRFTGTLGVLVRAKAAGRVDRVGPHLRGLRKLGFRMTATVEAAILRAAAE